MGLLATIIPGFRTLRTPVTAGILWITSFLVFAVTHHWHFYVKHSSIVAANAFLPDWFGIVVIPAVLGAAYLLGSVMIGLTDPIVLRIIDTYRLLLGSVNRLVLTRAPREDFAPSLFLRLRRKADLITANARSLIYDYVISVLTDAGATGAAAMMFPFERLLTTLPQYSAQLSREAPTQYQEYDRIQAEAAFRMAVIPPLIVISLQFGLVGYGLIQLATALASIVLLSQSISLSRQANDILAIAARIGYLLIPEMKSLSAYLKDVDPRPESDGAWIGAIIIGLNRRGFFDENQAMINEATELDQAYDVAALHDYLMVNDADIAVDFARTFKRNRGIAVQKFRGTGADADLPMNEKSG